ncbi:unnamed protein product [Blepharisma stoltei]|uniref:Uncharacterized protein n=1 Tax=Blepharisma stoltei TaxID=1481888 RepID=A0AAU9K198_9CILI|nr:unnamed protein product [Blepharisma stoltei]
MNIVSEVEVQTSFTPRHYSKHHSCTPSSKNSKNVATDFNSSTYYISGIIRSPSVGNFFTKKPGYTRSQSILRDIRAKERSFVDSFSQRKNILCRMLKIRDKSLKVENERKKIIDRIEHYKLNRISSKSKTPEKRNFRADDNYLKQEIVYSSHKENQNKRSHRCSLHRVVIDPKLIPQESSLTDIQGILQMLECKNPKLLRWL